VAEYGTMIGDDTRARRCIAELEARGRIVERMGVRHVAFPTWTPLPAG
jgi:hypothetical protein